jgi:hypothetical protein
MEILKDPVWQFIGIVISSILVITIYILQRKTKKLSYEVLSNSQLLTVEEELQGKVKVLYDGNEVKNVHLLTIKIINDGNQSILPTDFVRPLRISVNLSATILTKEIIDENPQKLGIEYELDGNTIIFTPSLLNAKDSFTLKMLVSNLDGRINFDCRINGVQDISNKQNKQTAKFLIGFFISSCFVGYGIFHLKTTQKYTLFNYEFPGTAIALTSIIIGYLIVALMLPYFKILRKILITYIRKADGYLDKIDR